MARRGKKYQEVSSKIDKNRAYPPREALALAKEARFARFDETVELHLKMGLDPRHSDQQVRSIVQLPHGLGKNIRVLVFAQGEAAQIAREAGADYVGGDELIKKIEEGFLDFDVSLATPDMMGKVGRLGKILGRRGLMPNPRLGTVVPAEDLPRAIREAKMGRVEFRMDRTATIHIPIGKVSFDDDKLLENLSSAMEAVVRAKPSGAKGQYIQSAHLCTTMGPGIKLDLKSTLALASGR